MDEEQENVDSDLFNSDTNEEVNPDFETVSGDEGDWDDPDDQQDELEGTEDEATPDIVDELEGTEDEAQTDPDDQQDELEGTEDEAQTDPSMEESAGEPGMPDDTNSETGDSSTNPVTDAQRTKVAPPASDDVPYLDDEKTTQAPAVEYEINRAAEAGFDMRGYSGLYATQLRQIRLALQAGKTQLAEHLRDGQYDYLQMELIRRGAEEGLQISTYDNPAYDPNQMWEIMEGLRSGVDVTRYARMTNEEPVYTAHQMRQIRVGLEDNINTTVYEQTKLTPQEMDEIRRSLPKNKGESRLKQAARILFGPRGNKHAKKRPEY